MDLWFLSQWWNEIERKGPKIKKALEKGGVLEIIWKINLGSWSLKMTQLRHFRFLYLKKKHFWYTCLFMLFFSFWLVREERKGLLDSDDERKSHLSPQFQPPKWVYWCPQVPQSWWLFEASMLHEKPDWSRESQN